MIVPVFVWLAFVHLFDFGNVSLAEVDLPPQLEGVELLLGHDGHLFRLVPVLGEGLG